ncbi:hypothetical protein [Hankyongella ginsenosidimutans]|uniref:hypothetical protein n=1 Tax=Hankyongella ginsenosidimutans TaxID=1763828 RepID=UPI001CA37280|nr:hypothetical protein [Hankyongella ginsenosidimutans]
MRWRTKDLDLALGKTTLALSPAGARVASHLAASLHTEAARIEGLRAPIALDIDPDGGVRAPAAARPSASPACVHKPSILVPQPPGYVPPAALFALAANGAVRSQATLALSPWSSGRRQRGLLWRRPGLRWRFRARRRARSSSSTADT